MTTKEAIFELCAIYVPSGNVALINENTHRAIEMAIDALSQLHLPSNLDEAAEEWCKMNNKGIALSADKKPHYLVDGKDAFKACAEWMAGQGETIFDTIDVDDKGQRWISDNLLQGDYDCGEEVIVQIRKKITK